MEQVFFCQSDPGLRKHRTILDLGVVKLEVSTFILCTIFAALDFWTVLPFMCLNAFSDGALSLFIWFSSFGVFCR